MDANEIKLAIAAEDVYRLVKEIKLLEAELNHTQLDLEVARRDFDTYKAAQVEREANIRKQNEREYERRLESLELNERKAKAFNEYLGAKGLALNAIKEILCKRVTKKDDAKLKPHLDRITEAWMRFDAIQKDIAKEFQPPALKDAICDSCAAKMGKVPVARPVGHWIGYCDFCGHEKSLRSLSRDYVDREGANE